MIVPSARTSEPSIDQPFLCLAVSQFDCRTLDSFYLPIQTSVSTASHIQALVVSAFC